MVPRPVALASVPEEVCPVRSPVLSGWGTRQAGKGGRAAGSEGARATRSRRRPETAGGGRMAAVAAAGTTAAAAYASLKL